jgi:hypothetical protein
MPSANALWLGDARWRLARPICGTYGKHFAERRFEFFLLPSIVHARLVVELVETHTQVPR